MEDRIHGYISPILLFLGNASALNLHKQIVACVVVRGFCRL